jgi:hypothetical protein
MSGVRFSAARPRADNGIGIPLSDPNMMIQSSFVGWDFGGMISTVRNRSGGCVRMDEVDGKEDLRFERRSDLSDDSDRSEGKVKSKKRGDRRRRGICRPLRGLGGEESNFDPTP